MYSSIYVLIRNYAIRNSNLALGDSKRHAAYPAFGFTFSGVYLKCASFIWGRRWGILVCRVSMSIGVCLNCVFGKCFAVCARRWRGKLGWRFSARMLADRDSFLENTDLPVCHWIGSRVGLRLPPRRILMTICFRCQGASSCSRRRSCWFWKLRIFCASRRGALGQGVCMSFCFSCCNCSGPICDSRRLRLRSPC